MNVVRGVRRGAIIVIVVSLAIAAAVGIVALLSGEFGDLQSKVLLSTLTVAAFGTTALCHLAVVARAVRVVGFVGIGASAAAAVSSFVLIWGEWPGWEWQEPWTKALVVLSILAVSLAQANLLLLLAARPQLVVRLALGVTLAAIAIVAVMVWVPVLSDGEIPGEHGEGYWRGFGVVAILDALGTIALPILALVLRRSAAPRPRELRLELPDDLAARLDSRAESGGMTREQITLDALEAHLR